MAFGDKPTSVPEWADGGSAEIDEPLLAEKQLGYIDSQVPDAGKLNWWMNLVYDWTGYLQALETKDHSWSGTNEFDNATIGGGGEFTIGPSSSTAFMDVQNGSVVTFHQTSQLSFVNTANALFASGTKAVFDDSALLQIGHGTGAATTALLSVKLGGGVALASGNTTSSLTPFLSFASSTGSNLAPYVNMTDVGDSALGHVPFIKFGANNQLRLDPALAIANSYAGFQVSDGAFYAGVGFFTPGYIRSQATVQGLTVSTASVAGGGGGFTYTDVPIKHYVVPAHDIRGRIFSSSSAVEVSTRGVAEILYNSTDYPANNVLTAFARIPEGAQITKVDVLCSNASGAATAAINYQLDQFSVTDETSDFAQAFFNTSGSSGDTMTLAISATKAWVTASLATHPTCVENGTIRFRFNFIASSGIFQVYAVRFRYTLPKEAPSF